MFRRHETAPVHYRYWAFISYSHHDERWARKLMYSLEHTNLPNSLMGKSIRGLNETVPRRLYPIFRDRDELPVSTNLNDNIHVALEQSCYLIVICSPHAAASLWVNEEVRQFKLLGREARILPVIVDGDPHAAAKSEDARECFPAALRFRLNENGDLTDEKVEPVAADTRRGRDGFRNSALKVMAGIIHADFSELRKRDQEWRLRWSIAVSVGLLCLVLLLSCLSWYAIARQFAMRRAQAQTFFVIGSAESERMDQGDAIAYLSASLRMNPRHPGSIARLITQLTQTPFLLPSDIEIKGHYNDAVISIDGTHALTQTSEKISYWNLKDTTTPVVDYPLSNKPDISYSIAFSSAKPYKPRIYKINRDIKYHHVEIIDMLSNTIINNIINIPINHDYLLMSDSLVSLYQLSEIKQKSLFWDCRTNNPMSRFLPTSLWHKPIIDFKYGYIYICRNETKIINNFKIDVLGQAVEPITETYIACYDINNGRRIGEAIIPPSSVSAISNFPGDTPIVLAGCNDHNLYFFNMMNGDLLPYYAPEIGEIKSIITNASGSHVAMTSENTVSVLSNQNSFSLPLQVGRINAVSFPETIPDVLIATDNDLSLYHVKNYPRRKSADNTIYIPGYSTLKFNSTGRYLLATNNSQFLIWDLQNGVQIVVYVDTQTMPTFMGDDNQVLFVDNGVVYILDIGTVSIKRLSIPGISNIRKIVRCTSNGSDEYYVIVAIDNAVTVKYLYDFNANNICYVARDKENIEIMFSPDGKYCAEIDNDNMQIRIIEIKADNCIGQMKFDQYIPFLSDHVVFSNNGNMLLILNNGVADLWKYREGTHRQFPCKMSNWWELMPVFSNDDSYLLVHEEKNLPVVYNTNTGRLICRMKVGPGMIRGNSVFSPDNSYIAEETVKGEIRFWDRKTGDECARIKSMSNTVSWAISPRWDGIVTVNFLGDSKYIHLNTIFAEVPAWLPEFTEVVCGKHISRDGNLEVLLNQSASLREVMKKIKEDNKHTVYRQWAEWLISDPETRPLSPDGLTVPREKKYIYLHRYLQ